MKIYTLTNRLNGKVYVGATSLSMARRTGALRQDAKRGKKYLISQAIREHGWENFDVAVIATAETLEEALHAEADAIVRLNALHPNGYNRSDYGSNGWHFTEEERRRCSEAARHALTTGSRTPWNKGISTGPLSDATKRKLSRVHRGRKAWNKGVKASDETRLKLSQFQRSVTHWNERRVEFNGAIYPSLATARRALGLSKMQMRYRISIGRARYVDEPIKRKG